MRRDKTHKSYAGRKTGLKIHSVNGTGPEGVSSDNKGFTIGGLFRFWDAGNKINNPFLKNMQKAAEENRLEEYYQHTKRNFEESYKSYKAGSLYAVFYEMFIRDIEEAYRIIKNGGEERELKMLQEHDRMIMKIIDERMKAGSIIKFGRYPFGEDGTEKPVKWIILENFGDGTALLLSRYCLDAAAFSSNTNNWENSRIRMWLNKDFYNKAFNGKERVSIIESCIECVKKGFLWDSKYTVNDNVFLLSKEEAEKYFCSNEERRCWPAPYVKSVKKIRDMYTTGYVHEDENGMCSYWLRSPVRYWDYSSYVVPVLKLLFLSEDSIFSHVNRAAYVNSRGFISGFYTDHSCFGVRAALRINLKKYIAFLLYMPEK